MYLLLTYKTNKVEMQVPVARALLKYQQTNTSTVSQTNGVVKVLKEPD